MITEEEKKQILSFIRDRRECKEFSHWIDGDDDDYCKDCGDMAIDSLAQKGEIKFLDGGFERITESDYVLHCDTCGQVLRTNLSEIGLQDALETMIDFGFSDEADVEKEFLEHAIEQFGWFKPEVVIVCKNILDKMHIKSSIKVIRMTFTWPEWKKILIEDLGV